MVFMTACSTMSKLSDTWQLVQNQRTRSDKASHVIIHTQTSILGEFKPYFLEAKSIYG